MTTKKRPAKKLAKPVKAWGLLIRGELKDCRIDVKKPQSFDQFPHAEWVRVEIRELPKGKK